MTKNMAFTFKYFAYGSNLLEQRIHVNNKTAKRASIGRLKNYRLDFNFWSHRWKGCAATIAPHENEDVWGAIWEIDASNLADLDRQEGVEQGVYKVLSVDVEQVDGSLVTCRTYQLCDLPSFCSPLPPSRYPSQIYMNTIIDGAVESRLPIEYINKLKGIPHNDFNGPVNLHVPD